uniref:Uncharacterized protein n=1 Tax=Arion vulgaris TaxID=1028688 RepID=A0A0B7BGG8_9EUPU
MTWENGEASIRCLMDKSVHIDNSKCCNQYCNLEKFASSYKNQLPWGKKVV